MLLLLLLLLGIGMCLWPRIVLTPPRPDLRRPPSPDARVWRLTEVVSVHRLIVDTEAWPLGRRLTHHPRQWPLLPQQSPRPLTRCLGLTRYHSSDLVTRRWRPHHCTSPWPRLASTRPVMRRRRSVSVRTRRPHQARRRRSHGSGASHVRGRRPETGGWRMMVRMRSPTSHARVTSRGEHPGWSRASETKWWWPHAWGRPRSSHPEWHRTRHPHERRSTSHPREWESRKPRPSSKVSASSITLEKYDQLNHNSSYSMCKSRIRGGSLNIKYFIK